MPNSNDISGLWHAFQYDLYQATASLLYLLQGMETVRAHELAHYNALSTVHKTYAACFPKVSYIPVTLSMSGPSFDLDRILRHEGEAEQLAFKGWLEEVYNSIWEGKYRNYLKKMFEGKDIIRPEGDPMGDLRHIRNDMVHNAAVASIGETGKCKVLTWFHPGDPMDLGMRHVLDFLNQMGFMTTHLGFLSHGPAAQWSLFPNMEEALRRAPTPRPVSLRMSFDSEREDGSTWHVASVVFENSIFVNVPIDYAANSMSLRERINYINETRIDQDGNLRFPNGEAKDRQILYEEAIDSLLQRGPKIEGLGVPGPAFRFRKSKRERSD